MILYFDLACSYTSVLTKYANALDKAVFFRVFPELVLVISCAVNLHHHPRLMCSA